MLWNSKQRLCAPRQVVVEKTHCGISVHCPPTWMINTLGIMASPELHLYRYAMLPNVLILHVGRQCTEIPRCVFASTTTCRGAHTPAYCSTMPVLVRRHFTGELPSVASQHFRVSDGTSRPSSLVTGDWCRFPCWEPADCEQVINTCSTSDWRRFPRWEPDDCQQALKHMFYKRLDARNRAGRDG